MTPEPSAAALLAETQAITQAMADSRDLHARLAARRRELLFALNREHGLTYKQLRDETGLAWSRLIEEIGRVRDERGAERLPPGRRQPQDAPEA